jgi:hypothetical protein
LGVERGEGEGGCQGDEETEVPDSGVEGGRWHFRRKCDVPGRCRVESASRIGEAIRPSSDIGGNADGVRRFGEGAGMAFP